MPRFAFDAIGTRWEIDTREAMDAALCRRILACVDEFDAVYSRFRTDSLVARIASAREGGHFTFPAEAAALFDLYDALHERTHGAIDPLVGRSLELLGYDRTYSLEPDTAGLARHSQDLPRWATDIRRNGAVLSTKGPLVVDVGAAGKGFLVDIVAKLLLVEGLEAFLVDGSGDLRHFGAEDVRIGLEHPLDPHLAIGIAHLRGNALCASAVNRRAWGDGMHHILDAREGMPVRDVVATWVVAEKAAIADGLSTALFVASPDSLGMAFDFSYVRMFADGRAEISPDFPGELFT